MNKQSVHGFELGGAAKFSDPERTCDGKERASVPMTGLETLWFNTGTLCNIECANCYILSSPKNDALVYLTVDDVRPFLDEIRDGNFPTKEIGLTGGEPFMNPGTIAIMELALERGFELLVLTNAMRPMMRPSIRRELERLNALFGDRITLRVSLDHYSEEFHDQERGKGSFEVTLTGMRWLRDLGIHMAVAGRSLWSESDERSRAGFAGLFEREGFMIDAYDPQHCVIFPEMDEAVDVPEISTGCWDILGKRPEETMCASSRMVVRRRGASKPVVLSCTLLAYDRHFEMGQTLSDASGPVSLNHPHCSKFCVLGGASCSG
ncbi:MAG: radical SAM protein [Pseudomonadota bacterium]